MALLNGTPDSPVDFVLNVCEKQSKRVRSGAKWMEDFPSKVKGKCVTSHRARIWLWAMGFRFFMRRSWRKTFIRRGLWIALFLAETFACAATTVSVPDAIAHPGRSVSVPILLETDAELVGVQFDVRLRAELFTETKLVADPSLPEEIRVRSGRLSAGHYRLAVYGTGTGYLPSQRVAQLQLVIAESSLLTPGRIQLESLLLGGAASPVAVDGGILRSGTLSIVPAPAEIHLSGRVRYYSGGQAVSGVAVKVRGEATADGVGNEEGSFDIRAPSGVPIALSLEKRTDSPPNRGVTVLDLLLVERHVLGKELLESPWKRLAANVDRRGGINAADTFLMRQVIHGSADRYVSDQPVFHFLPADAVFSDAAQPWEAPDFIRHESPAGDLSEQDFIGVKLGDVDGDWGGVNSLAPNSIGNRLLSIASRKQSLPRNEPVELAIEFGRRQGAGKEFFAALRAAEGFRGVTSLQFTLVWNPAELAFDGVSQFGLPNLSESHFGICGVERGRLSFAWADASLKGLTLAGGESLFSLRFRRLAAQIKTSMRFGAEPTPALAVKGFLPVALSLLRNENNAAQDAKIDFDFVMMEAGNSKIFLTVWCEEGARCYLECADQLPTKDWMTIDKQLGQGGWIRFEDSPAKNQSRFYRVRKEFPQTRAKGRATK